jgi:hypothetical protein
LKKTGTSAGAAAAAAGNTEPNPWDAPLSLAFTPSALLDPRENGIRHLGDCSKMMDFGWMEKIALWGQAEQLCTVPLT